MAGEEKARGEWINKMFQDEEVDAVFCQRGGAALTELSTISI